MIKHMKINHLARQYKCSHYQCVESFDSIEQLEVHKEKSHIRIQCPHCPKTVMTTSLDAHIQRMHNNTIQAICELCGKSFSSKYLHKTHIPLEHGNVERVQCDICKGWFKDKSNIQKHMRIIHCQGPQKCNVRIEVFFWNLNFCRSK